MLISVGTFLLELMVLLALSRSLLRSIFELLLLLTRSRTLAVTAITLSLFPGTVSNELAHVFTAEVLGVKTGRLNLAPDTISPDEVHAGSVAIGHSDPFRRYLIGLAPVFVGLLILVAISYWIPNLTRNVLALPQTG